MYNVIMKSYVCTSIGLPSLTFNILYGPCLYLCQYLAELIVRHRGSYIRDQIVLHLPHLAICNCLYPRPPPRLVIRVTHTETNASFPGTSVSDPYSVNPDPDPDSSISLNPNPNTAPKRIRILIQTKI
jgi:hypothetical protein